ncbi:hypothetical protein KI387_012619, partial [Taxus chinensis]
SSCRVGMCTVSDSTAQCSSHSQIDVVPECEFSELSSSVSGYPLLHLSRSLIFYFELDLINWFKEVILVIS